MKIDLFKTVVINWWGSKNLQIVTFHHVEQQVKIFDELKIRSGMARW